jgi:hypothetical protein
MGNLAKKVAILLLLNFYLVGCQKDKIQLNSSIIEYEATKPSISNTKATQKGEIACAITLTDSTSCVGKRCGTPKGDCGKVETKCKCIESSKGFLPEGMTLEEFNELWNTTNGEQYLRSMGYSSNDL